MKQKWKMGIGNWVQGQTKKKYSKENRSISVYNKIGSTILLRLKCNQGGK